MNIGTLFERLFPKLFGGERVKGSGSLWYRKLDIDNEVSLLVSGKATEKESFRLTKTTLQEAFDAVHGPGGVGGEYTEIVVVDFVEDGVPKSTDKMIAILDMNDLYRLLSENRKLFFEDKNTAKHRRASIPSLFRNK